MSKSLYLLKLWWKTVFILVFFPLLSFFIIPSSSFAKDYSIQSVVIDAQLNSDGSMDITEKRIYKGMPTLPSTWVYTLLFQFCFLDMQVFEILNTYKKNQITMRSSIRRVSPPEADDDHKKRCFPKTYYLSPKTFFI